jgi:hypothetical protein
MPLDLCTISGTVYDASGSPKGGVAIYAMRMVKSGVVIASGQRLVVTSNEDGEVEFTLPRDSSVYLHGSFFVGALNFNGGSGQAVTIPDAETATLESLGAAVSIPEEGMTVKSNGSSLANLIGTLDFSTDFTVAESPTGEANVSLATSLIVTQEQVQDALSAFFPDSGPYDWTYDDAGNKVGLVIAVATPSVSGLMSAADKTLFDEIGSRNAANGYAGLNGSGLLTESQIPSAIARDSEVTALVDGLSLIYQPLNTKLTSIAGLANGTGYLHNDGTGVFAYQEVDLSTKADLASPSFSGIPTAPTAAQGTNTTQLSTTAFVRTEIAALVGSVPATLDTLDELAQALGDDPNFATTITNALALKANASSLTAVATSGSASDLGAGTLPDARFPATLPASSGVNLTSLNASNVLSGTLADGRLSANVPLLNAANVFSAIQAFNARATVSVGQISTAVTDLLINPTTKASGNLIDAQVNGVSKFKVDSAGIGTLVGSMVALGFSASSGSIKTSTNGVFEIDARSKIGSTADGNIKLGNQAYTDFGLLQFGGTTSSFPALKRSGTVLQHRTASDSAYAEVDALEYRASGTKVIGAQGAAVADATDAPSAITQLNLLLARIRAHGLIAT